jgi:hypothetical protein
MDFTNLILSPLAAIASFLIVTASPMVRPRCEHRVLLPAFVVSLFLNALLVQPWYYTTGSAFLAGAGAMLIFTVFGFAFGAFVGLLLVKAMRLARECLWPRD